MGELKAALMAIAEGYEFTIHTEGDHYTIVVENPRFVEDDGSNPFLVFEAIKEQ